MFRKFTLRAAALVFVFAGAVQAEPVLFDFTGTGQVQGYAGGPATVIYAGAFTGTISFELLAPHPTNPGDIYAQSDSGWVQTRFLIQWGDSSFSPGTVPGEVAVLGETGVYNGPDVDFLFNTDVHNGVTSDPRTIYESVAALERSTRDLSWLSSLEFDPTLGLAPGTAESGTVNAISFESFFSQDRAITGFTGYVDLLSMTRRTQAVPEPATLALFSLALAGVFVARRRRVQTFS